MDPAIPSTREKILDVAEPLFANRGLSGVGMRQVAQVVGLSKSTLFHHFRTKLHLYQEVLVRALTRIDDCLQAPLNSTGTAADKLEAWLEALVDALAGHPPTARLLLRGLFENDELPVDEDGIEGAEAALLPVIQGFQALLLEGIASGEFREVSVEDATQTVIGATVYHFASGEVGEQLMGAPIFSTEAIRRRKREVSNFVKSGLAATPA